jgi:pimeloyl-ACP methyl ester carboxylesterase
MIRAAVVYVHGLWMTGVESVLLRRRLERERGYQPRVFHYRSIRVPMANHVAALREVVAAIEAPQVHLVGHSLGGIVILRYLEQHRMVQPGRVVFIGTPAVGSVSARHLAQWGWGRAVLGRTVAQELLQPHQRHWSCDRELGIIAGTAPLGLARLLVRFGEDNDGVVTVSETRLPGAKEFLRLRASHSGMLLSATVARETGSFLEYGSFGR